MTVKTISKLVTKTVRLGTQRYGATLTVTASGSVVPAEYGATGVFASVANADLTNDGKIEGGYGGANTIPGGIGVNLATGGTVANMGVIVGGGGYQTGGIGVDLAHGGTLANAGQIAGGDAPTQAGAGVVLGGGSLTNSGDVQGGSGGNHYKGLGGVGVDVTNAALVTNDGTIAGGYSSYGTAGNGLVLRTGGTVVNAGDIFGGRTYDYRREGEAGSGVDLVFGASLQNTGTIGGGNVTNEYGGDQGGTGLSAASSRVQNSGLIYGGTNTLGLGGTGAYLHASILTNAGTLDGGSGASPGTGLLATAGSEIKNTGTIAAGISIPVYVQFESHDVPGLPSPPPTYGAGIDLTVAATLLNMGVVSGSNGADTAGYGSEGGRGTTGIDLEITATAVNDGQILGGSGGNSLYYGDGAVGGNGGDGAYLTANTTLTNAGTIAAGAGGSALHGHKQGYGGNGGVGVFIDGGTLVDTGMISGAAGGAGVTQDGAAGDAVQFGSVAGTLEITRTADFNGLVAANASVNDVLVLNGNGQGFLIGLGETDFTGFTTVDDYGDWELRGASTISANGTLNLDGMLEVTGRLRDAGVANVQGPLDVAGAGAVLLTSLTMGYFGTLSVSQAAELVVGRSLGNAEPGMIVLDAGETIAAQGTIGDAQATGIIDNAMLDLGDVGYVTFLSLVSPTSGTGTINLGDAGTLTVTSTLGGPSVVFGANSQAELINAGTGSITSTLTGFSNADLIDERRLTVTSVSFDAGTLTLLDGSAAVGTLFLAGSYTTASFALSPDNLGGTDIYLGGEDVGVTQAVKADAAWHGAMAWRMPDDGLRLGVWDMLAHHGGPL